MKTLVILFILTSHATIGDTGKPTGLWLEEFTTPYYAFVDAGYTVEVASIRGGTAPIDPASNQGEVLKTVSITRFMADARAQEKLKSTISLEQVDRRKYAAIFLPGGHGTMWDLPESKPLAELISTSYQEGKIIAAVCHGPAGLVKARGSDGKPLVNGKRVTGFTNEEEEAVGLTKAVPFLLEDRLKSLGANYQKTSKFASFAIADGNLITGQNPASSEEAARLVIEKLRAVK